MKYYDPIQIEIKHFRELLKFSNIDVHPHYYSNLIKSARAILPDDVMAQVKEMIIKILDMVNIESLMELEYFLNINDDYDSFFTIDGDLIADYGHLKVYDEIRVTKFDFITMLEDVVSFLIDEVNKVQNKIPMTFSEM